MTKQIPSEGLIINTFSHSHISCRTDLILTDVYADETSFDACWIFKIYKFMKNNFSKQQNVIIIGYHAHMNYERLGCISFIVWGRDKRVIAQWGAFNILNEITRISPRTDYDNLFITYINTRAFIHFICNRISLYIITEQGKKRRYQ